MDSLFKFRVLPINIRYASSLPLGITTSKLKLASEFEELFVGFVMASTPVWGVALADHNLSVFGLALEFNGGQID